MCRLLLQPSFPETPLQLTLGVLSGHITGKTFEQAQVLSQDCNTVQNYPPARIFFTVEHFPQFSSLFLKCV